MAPYLLRCLPQRVRLTGFSCVAIEPMKLVTTVTQSTCTTEFAYAAIDRAGSANITELHFHEVGLFPGIV